MIRRQGMEVVPVASEGSDGREVVTDFEIVGGNTVGRDGVYQGWQDDWTPDSEGNFHHAYQDSQAPEEESLYSEDEYWDNVLDAEPRYSAAIEWASQSYFTDEQREAWDKKMDTGSDDEIHAALDQLLATYLENGGEVEDQNDESEQDESDEPSPEEIAQVEEVASELMSAEPIPETADAWDEVGVQALNTGDETYSAICSMTAAFNRGEISAGEAIDSILNAYPLADVKRCYEYIQQHG